ncbi:hypothetical protein IQ16_01941 [Bradyrhizobium huanghuaihaiense]|uniref:Helix-turn-helix protein n=1 Tax=Bradyrhizobium huanghuaihaiense TaxID=990078 RepID=A0A562RXJ3_9BRAD|nr:hypothetical protein [Bradyrhizobium huanghuaihaiense]TWI73797.1 hypothetical protein IQ16_01941 [Bradyrhizobium huanghuaihaiense]
MTEPTASILDGFAEESRFAADNGISLRTSLRYRNMPDGLPFLEFGGKIFIPLAGARDWLNNRVKRRNPGRRAA